MKPIIPLLCAICACLPLTAKAAEPSGPFEKEKRLEPVPKPDPHALPVKMWFIQFQPDPGQYGDPNPDRVPESEAQIDAREWLQKHIDAFRPLQPGEFGATLETEASLAPQTDEIIDVVLAYHFRAPGPPVLNWSYGASVSVKNGVPALLKLESLTPEENHDHPAKLRALIVKADVERFGEITPHPEFNLTLPDDPPAPK